MVREYHKWTSSCLRREMELLVFGHAGLPVVVYPTLAAGFSSLRTGAWSEP